MNRLKYMHKDMYQSNSTFLSLYNTTSQLKSIKWHHFFISNPLKRNFKIKLDKRADTKDKNTKW